MKIHFQTAFLLAITMSINAFASNFLDHENILTEKGVQKMAEVKVDDRLVSYDPVQMVRTSARVSCKDFSVCGDGGGGAYMRGDCWTEHVLFWAGNTLVSAREDMEVFRDSSGWTRLTDLDVGDMVVTCDGTFLPITRLSTSPGEWEMVELATEARQGFCVSSALVLIRGVDRTKYGSAC